MSILTSSSATFQLFTHRLRTRARDAAVAALGVAFVLSAVAALQYNEQIAPALDRLTDRVQGATQMAVAIAKNAAKLG